MMRLLSLYVSEIASGNIANSRLWEDSEKLKKESQESDSPEEAEADED